MSTVTPRRRRVIGRDRAPDQDGGPRPPGERAAARLFGRGVALVVIAFIVGVLVAPGGASGLATYRDENLVALAPGGWKDEVTVAPYGTALAGWLDVSNPKDSETVQATLPARLSAQARAAARARALSRLKGYRQSYLGPLSLPGGRQVWELQYALAGTDTAVFEFNACSPAIAMTVTLDASSPGRLKTEDDSLPQGAEPVCDGPAFTSPDRADLALPLSLPS